MPIVIAVAIIGIAHEIGRVGARAVVIIAIAVIQRFDESFTVMREPTHYDARHLFDSFLELAS